MSSTKKFKVFSPTRADLAGGTLDLWPLHCLVGESYTINTALSLGFHFDVEIQPGKFGVELRNSDGNVWKHPGYQSLVAFDSLPGTLRFPSRIIWEYFRLKERLPELEMKISFYSQIPRQSGLGGSSSLCVGLVRLLSHLTRDYFEQGWQWKMLRFLQDVEARHLKTATGTQDYLAPLFGGLNAFVSDLGEIHRKKYSQNVLDGLKEHFLLVFSGEMHDSGLSNWEIFKKALEQDTEMLRGLAGIKRVADDLNKELDSQQPQWQSVGKLLNEEWEIRKKVFKVHTPRLLEIFDFLKEQPILGAKVCGAAQGGSLIILVKPEHRPAVKAKLTENRIEVLDAEPSDRMVQIQQI